MFNKVSPKIEWASEQGFIPEENFGQFDGRFGRNLSSKEQELFGYFAAAVEDGVLNRLSERERQCFIDLMISNEPMTVVEQRYRLSRSSIRAYVERAATKIRKFIRKRYGE